ncbi:MAG: exodeoxyribonuclease VII large subunit [Bacteroidales bacterium]|nr:exodeoxyribonuclease VII large subunit [Bacteroidales bacterium]
MSVEGKITLLELNNLVKESINQNLSTSYWVIAEIAEIKEHSSGHCYLELVYKDKETENIKAKARATIWNYTYRMLKPYFETATGQSLVNGLTILVNVQVVFHEFFGYSLNILDIDPTYTIGEIELRRRETINKLIADGVYEMNKEVEIDDVPKRIAIISSENAAGYQDFRKQLSNNPYGYVFSVTLFPAIMQGDEAENSIINQLGNIYSQINNFDVVIIVRGGGSQTDLSCFDSYELASNVAQFPLPVITGIGHDKDTSVTDMVAHTSVKTPTAAAEFIIARFNDADTELYQVTEKISSIIKNLLDENLSTIQKYSQLLVLHSTKEISKYKLTLNTFVHRASKADLIILYNSNKLSNLGNALKKTPYGLKILKRNLELEIEKLKTIPNRLIKTEKNKVEFLSRTSEHLDPKNILHRGYSMTYSNNEIIKSSKQVKKNDVITTILSDGTVSSIINKTSN